MEFSIFKTTKICKQILLESLNSANQKAYTLMGIGFLIGGSGGIRTHDTLPYTWFRVKAVMTTSIHFRI